MILLLSTMWFGVMAMAYSLLLSSVISQIINSWPNRKLLGYGYLEQVKDFAPGILLAVGMGVCVYFVGYLPIFNADHTINSDYCWCNNLYWSISIIKIRRV